MPKIKKNDSVVTWKVLAVAAGVFLTHVLATFMTLNPHSRAVLHSGLVCCLASGGTVRVPVVR